MWILPGGVVSRPADPNKAHGLNGYATHKCRCGVCRTAEATHQREIRRKRRDSGVLPTAHGFSTYINWMCRCEICRAANAKAQRDFQARRKAAL